MTDYFGREVLRIWSYEDGEVWYETGEAYDIAKFTFSYDSKHLTKFVSKLKTILRIDRRFIREKDENMVHNVEDLIFKKAATVVEYVNRYDKKFMIDIRPQEDVCEIIVVEEPHRYAR